MTPSMKRSKAVVEDKREPRIRSLLDSLASRDPVLREQARETLVVVGKPAVPLLIPLLSHRKPHVRWEAAKTLCDIADPIAATALVNILDDSDGDVRWLAAEGLAALGRDGLHPLLAALLDRAQIILVLRGRTPRLSHFGQEEKARHDSSARVGSPRTGRAGDRSAAGCLYCIIETARVVLRK